MTILVDIDSTITNFSQTLLQVNNSLHGTSYTYDEITSYDWFDNTFNNPWKPTDYRDFWDTVKVNPKAVETIESWVKLGHKVYLVTASHFNNMLGYKLNKTLEAFNSALVNERNVIVAQDKTAIRGDVMIDDCTDNLKQFNGIRICYAQPWNKGWIESLRIDNWYRINSVVYDLGSINYSADEKQDF